MSFNEPQCNRTADNSHSDYDGWSDNDGWSDYDC
jgi:hypothetical protein